MLQNGVRVNQILSYSVDLLLLILAVVLAAKLRFGDEIVGLASFARYIPAMLFFVCTTSLVLFLFDFYEADSIQSRTERVRLLFGGFLAALGVLAVAYYFWPNLYMGRGFLAISLVAGFGLIMLRIFFLARLHRWSFLQHKILVLGVGEHARDLVAMLKQNPNPFLVVLGFVHMDKQTAALIAPNLVIEASPGESLLGLARRLGVQQIVVALSERRGLLPLEQVMDCKLAGIRVTDLVPFYERVAGRILIEKMRPSQIIFSEGYDVNAIQKLGKRSFDIVCALLALLLLAPVAALVALAIRCDSSGAALYRQERVGEAGKPFNMYKFRSMREDAEIDGPVWASQNDPRVTRVGRVLRNTRLDELPQLWNILMGDMSFVGPRPERPAFVIELEQVIPYYAQRLVVKPGLTGWAQISCQYSASVEDAVQKLEYDLYYIKNMSVWLDLRILLGTLSVVLWGKGAR